MIGELCKIDGHRCDSVVLCSWKGWDSFTGANDGYVSGRQVSALAPSSISANMHGLNNGALPCMSSNDLGENVSKTVEDDVNGLPSTRTLSN